MMFKMQNDGKLTKNKYIFGNKMRRIQIFRLFLLRTLFDRYFFAKYFLPNYFRKEN